MVMHDNKKDVYFVDKVDCEPIYNIGDVVKINSLDWYNNKSKNSYGYIKIFSIGMTKYCGKRVIINDILPDNIYILDIDNGYHCWTPEMFELATNTITDITELPQSEPILLDKAEKTEEEVNEYISEVEQVKVLETKIKLIESYNQDLQNHIVVKDKEIEQLKEEYKLCRDKLNELVEKVNSLENQNANYQNTIYSVREYLNLEFGINSEGINLLNAVETLGNLFNN